jgi:hypothetical protein
VSDNISITTSLDSGPITADKKHEEQYVIKSCLHGPKFVQNYINDLVIATSELEARGNLVFTLALLRCSEQEGIVPVQMFTQTFTTACIRVTRSSTASTRYPTSEICQRYLVDALQHVPPMSDYDFTYFGQLYNQLGKRMLTMVMTSLCRHMNSRRSRAIRISIMNMFPKLSKSVCSFLTKQILWSLSGAPTTSCRRPDPSRYTDPQVRIVGISLLEDPKIIELINAHTDQFQHRTLDIDPDDGYFSDENIKNAPHVFFQYLKFLFQAMENILLKAPFQLIPQFTVKRRSITLGKEQVAELMMRLSKTKGLVESLGIDIDILASRETVFCNQKCQ